MIHLSGFTARSAVNRSKPARGDCLSLPGCMSGRRSDLQLRALICCRWRQRWSFGEEDFNNNLNTKRAAKKRFSLLVKSYWFPTVKILLSWFNVQSQVWERQVKLVVWCLDERNTVTNFNLFDWQSSHILEKIHCRNRKSMSFCFFYIVFKFICCIHMHIICI